MGVIRRAPWWLGWALAAGLVSIFAGERILDGSAVARSLLSGGGALLVVGCALWRAHSWRSVEEGETRRVEGLLTLAYGGCVLALAAYVLSSTDGMSWLGIDFADPETENRYRTILQVLWPTILAVSFVPSLAAQLALGAHRQARGDAAGVESFRIVETATAGLVVALAGSFLFVLGYVVSERDRSLDLSYFRTASPGTATEAIVSSLDEPVEVLLFFPDVNPVKDEALRYFRRLADESGLIRIREHDRLVSPGVAEDYNVTEDGEVILVRGDQRERLTLGTAMNEARPTLRTLDREVQRILLGLVQENRTVYMTTGHGELNDPASGGPFAGTLLGEVDGLMEMLRFMNFRVRNFGLTTGLGDEIPDDAAIVMILGPRRPFLDEEMQTLDRYLARGGSLLVALDPDTEFELGPLEERLGLQYAPVPLADDRQHLRQRGDLSDRRLLITGRFSAHESVTTLSTAGAGAGVLFVGPGHLVRADGTDVNPIFAIRSSGSSFADSTGDYQFDPGVEERRAYNLMAAVQTTFPAQSTEESPEESAEGDFGEAEATNNSSAAPDAAAAQAAGDEERRTRALFFASSSVFSDAVVQGLGLNAALVADAVRWLGQDEDLAGITETEEDVPILHTREEDIVWFYSIIFGAPTLLLGAGLFGVYRHRRGQRRREA